jgi:hypothetical protein
VNVDVCCRNSLHSCLRSITVETGQVNLEIFFTHVEMRQSWKHHRVVVLFFAELIFKSNDLEALSAYLTSVNWPFSCHVIDFFMGVSVILNTGSHADDNTPRWVWGKYEDWIVDSSKLRMHSWLHFVPLVQLDRVLGEGSTERGSGVTMHAVTFWHLRLVIVTIWFDEALYVSHRCVEPIFDLFEDWEIVSLTCLSKRNTLLEKSDIFSSNEVSLE